MRSLAIRLAEASDITAGIDQISSGRMLFNPTDVIASQLETIDEDYSLIEKIFDECISFLESGRLPYYDLNV
jgi:hypothetical protein